jgi:hypothetical protein
MKSPNSYEMNFSMVIFVMHVCANLSPIYFIFIIIIYYYFLNKKVDLQLSCTVYRAYTLQF